jgi:hypothetical protein
MVWGRASPILPVFCRRGEMQWTVHPNDGQVALEMGDSRKVIKDH